MVDQNNNRVEKFLINGAYQTSICTACNGPIGVHLDSANNVWVSNWNINQLQEYTPSGTYVTGYGSTGTGNGQFKNMADFAIDGTGNFWISDWGL